MLYRSACPHCGGHLEFDSVHLGRTSNCPHCKNEILLSGGEPVEAESAGAEPAAWNVFARVYRSLGDKQFGRGGTPEERASRIEATMQQVRDGSWRVDVEGLVLSTNERALWQQGAAAVDPEVIVGAQENAAYAMTAKIFKSITTRLIQKPSQIRAASTPISPKTNIPGQFIVTTTRLVFTSKERTFITRYENIGDICSTLEGIRFFERGKSTAYGVKYNEPNGDIITQMIDFCMAETVRG